MSYDIIINSSVHNFGSNSREELEQVLNSVKNPKWHTDDNLDIVIDEDFDMRHITALAKWGEDEWHGLAKERLRKSLEKFQKPKGVEWEVHEGDIVINASKWRKLKEELGL